MRRWTEEDAKFLKANYVSYRDRGALADLATAMGRTKQWICRKAGENGLTDPFHKAPWFHLSQAELEDFSKWHDKMSDPLLAQKFGISLKAVELRRARLGLKKDRSTMWELTPHPRGFTGGIQSDEVRRRIGAAARKMWADPTHTVNSEESRQMRSDRSSKFHRNGKWTGGYSRGSSGRRSDLENRYFRSSWEANYARYLNWLKARGEIDGWEYEEDTFVFDEIKRGIRSYTPDFKITEKGKIHYDEVKGWMDQKSRVRLDRLAKYYPHVDLRLVGAAEYKEIAKAVSKLIPNWETRRNSNHLVQHGILLNDTPAVIGEPRIFQMVGKERKTVVKIEWV